VAALVRIGRALCIDRTDENVMSTRDIMVSAGLAIAAACLGWIFSLT
jgi:hypothetical protein